MKETIRNLLISLLLLIPVFLINFAYQEISAISTGWEQQNQEHQASHKLNEIAAHVDIAQQISAAGASFKKMASSLFSEYNDYSRAEKQINAVAQKVFSQPFPRHEMWLFVKKSGDRVARLKIAGDVDSPRRPMEMIAGFLADESSSPGESKSEYRRNEKLLQKIFGNGCTARLMAVEQKGVATPVIYRSVPSFMVWDAITHSNGEQLVFWVIVPRDQDLTGAVYRMAAEKAGLGKDVAGGFVSIYKTNTDDYLFPKIIGGSHTFALWREKLGTAESRLREWYQTGMPWSDKVGRMRIYSRILPLHKHIAVILLPDVSLKTRPEWLNFLNLMAAGIIVLIVVRGLLLGQWLFSRISQRFAIVFVLAVSLPVALFVTSSTAYIQERLKADENVLEQKLSTSLLDFDAGKELLETDYVSAFNGMLKDPEIHTALKNGGLNNSNAVFERIFQIANANDSRLPLSGLALYDLSGKLALRVSGSLNYEDFSTMAGFYGQPFTTNLRKTVAQDEPSFKLPVQNVDERNLAAMQSFKRSSGGIEMEIERFRYRVVRTDVGRGHVSYIYDFVAVDGRPRYVLMVAWLDNDVDRIVLGKAAANLGLKIPELKFAGFKRTIGGLEEILPPSRSVSVSDMKAFYRVADAASSIRSGMLKTISGNMSIVAYASKHFNRTVLVAGIDHQPIQSAHFYRKILFALLGILSISVLVLSAIITFKRLIEPVQIIKLAFDKVEAGDFPRLPETTRKDETGTLFLEFTRMVKGLEERQRLATLISDQAFEAVTSAANGEIETRSFHGILLVSDIRSFTTMCEKYEPQVITALLNRHFAEMAEIIARNGGRIYKFIGDAIEAVFMEDNQTFSAAERAVKSGVMMLQRLDSINQNRLSDNLFPYEMGVGITDGEFISGEIGSKESRLDYAILGKAFKKAETLEALTKNYGEFPLLVSSRIAESCSGFKFSGELAAGKEVFRLNEKPARIYDADVKEATVFSRSIKLNESDSAEKIIMVHADFSSRQRFVFLVGLIVLLFPVISILADSWASLKSEERRQREIAKNWCENSLNKVLVSDSQSIVFEEYIENLSERISQDFIWSSSGVTAEQLKSAGDDAYRQMVKDGFEPVLFAILHKPGGSEAKIPDEDWRLVNFYGVESQKDAAEALSRQFALKYYAGWPDVRHLQDKFQQLLGTGMSFMHLYNDMHARVSPIKRQGREEYYFWQPVYLRNGEKYAEVMREFSSQKVRSRPGEDAVLQVGTFMCIVPKPAVFKNYQQTLINILDSEPVEFAFRYKSDVTYVSGGFPVAPSELTRLSGAADVYGWHFESAAADNVEEGTRVWIGKKIEMPGKSGIIFTFFTVLAVLLWLIKQWYLAVFYEAGIANRFSWQLWVGLLAAAIVPLTAVYSLNERFAADKLEQSVAQEQNRLVEQFEELERRQFLQEVVEWDKLDKMSFDEDMHQAVSAVNQGADKSLLTETVRHLAFENPRIGLMRFAEMLVFHSGDWQHSVTPPGVDKETGEFNRFINAFVDLLFADLGVKIARQENQNKLGTAVKDEMTREAGLDIFRTVFGSDAYFKLVHGIGMPIHVFMATGVGCLKLVPYPGLVKPEMVFYWLFFDNLNSAMRSVFRVAESEFPVFTDSKVMYGALKQPWTGGWGHEVVKYARWALAKKAPLSARTVLADREFLVEARIGNHNEAMIMVGMIPEAGIFEKIESARQLNLFYLILSILAIIMLALLVAGDISSPVKELTRGVQQVEQQKYDYRIVSGRKDELGQILQSFNNMNGALQEKELMGQMLSGAARRVVSNEESLMLAEKGQRLAVSAFYLSVPGFEMFVDTLNASQLIAEVRDQIDLICRIIINNGGEVDKLMGEKVLAWFYSADGLDKSNRNAFSAMAEIRALEREGRLHFPVSVGIHCGEIIAGLLGVGNKRDFTIIGDPVNTAARICARGQELSCERFLISEEVKNSLELRDSAFREFGEVQLKGREASVRLCQVLFGR